MDELLTIAEVARMFHLHEMTIRRHIKLGKLKAIKVGSRIRVRKEDLERFVQPASTGRSFVPPSEAEIKRRRALFAETMRLREAIGPIGMTTSELVRLGREEE